MNAGALVYCLLDDEGVQTPEGYTLLDSAQVGDYELMLWEGKGHVDGEPVKFNEVSLNAKGRKFDAASQAQKYPGSVHALGHRYELLHVVADWIMRFGDLYIGSYQPGKLSVYHRMFKRYLPRLNVSEPYAAFDECEGKSEYFHVTGSAPVIESILLETMGDADVNSYIDALPDAMNRAIDEARRIYDAKRKSGELDDDNSGEWAESIVDEVVDKFNLTSGDEVVDVRTVSTMLHHVINR